MAKVYVGVLSVAAVLISIIMLTLPVEIQSQVNVDIPPDAVKWGLNKVDDWFTCAKYDGFAACWHNDFEKRDRLCSNGCSRGDKWSYDYHWGGKCYCCKCN